MKALKRWKSTPRTTTTIRPTGGAKRSTLRESSATVTMFSKVKRVDSSPRTTPSRGARSLTQTAKPLEEPREGRPRRRGRRRREDDRRRAEVPLRGSRELMSAARSARLPIKPGRPASASCRGRRGGCNSPLKVPAPDQAAGPADAKAAPKKTGSSESGTSEARAATRWTTAGSSRSSSTTSSRTSASLPSEKAPVRAKTVAWVHSGSNRGGFQQSGDKHPQKKKLQYQKHRRDSDSRGQSESRSVNSQEEKLVFHTFTTGGTTRSRSTGQSDHEPDERVPSAARLRHPDPHAGLYYGRAAAAGRK